MASRPKRATPRPAPRLYLITPQIADASAFSAQVISALEAGDVAAVLLRLGDGHERALINGAKSLAGAVQSKECALLIDGRFDLVARSGADGAHLIGVAALTEALDQLKPDRIAGVGGLASRHDAMVVAERGADYVMFGEPDAAGQRPALSGSEERVGRGGGGFDMPRVWDGVSHR